MGQYYYPTLYKQKGNRLYGRQFYSHDYDNGLKLTEHSYVGNNFVETVMTQLFNNPQRVYWCGDYFEKSDFENEKDYLRMRRTWKKYHVKINSDLTHESNYPHPAEVQEFSADKFIVNHTKKCFIDMKRYCKEAPTCTEDDNWYFHPLCLLTAVGNQRGGGDYYGINEEDVGSWAGDVIEIQQALPHGYVDCTDKIGFQESY